MIHPNPRLSVLSANKNNARYLRETLDSVLMQRFDAYEHILVDGASDDGSVAILKSYPDLRWISEPDEDANHAFDKAIRMARGEYVTFCPVSDGYLSRNWFAYAVKLLDENPEISLVWGGDALMTEDSDLFGLVFPQFHRKKAPSGRDFLPYWLGTRLWFPEQNYVIRRSLLLDMWPSRTNPCYFDRWNPFLRVILEFHKGGFLSQFAPIIPNYRRLHRDSVTNKIMEHGVKTLEMYVAEIEEYGQAILSGRCRHIFRDGAGAALNALDDLDWLGAEMQRWATTHPVHGPQNLK